MTPSSKLYSSTVDTQSRLEYAKTALIHAYGLHRQVANEVALEYARLVDFRQAYGDVVLPKDTLLGRFQQLVSGQNISTDSSNTDVNYLGSWAQLRNIYKARYGRSLPACWHKGSTPVQVVFNSSDTHTIPRNIDITPTHSMPINRQDFSPTGQEFAPTGQD